MTPVVAETRCFECARQIPDGDVQVGDILAGVGFDGPIRQRAFFCRTCRNVITRENAKDAEDYYYLRTGYMVLYFGVVAIISIASILSRL